MVEQFKVERAYPRADTELLVYLEQQDAERGVCYQTMGKVLNLSEGGLLVELQGPVYPGVSSFVTLALGPECVEVRAKLYRMRKAGRQYHAVFRIDQRFRRARAKIANYVQAKAA